MSGFFRCLEDMTLHKNSTALVQLQCIACPVTVATSPLSLGACFLKLEFGAYGSVDGMHLGLETVRAGKCNLRLRGSPLASTPRWRLHGMSGNKAPAFATSFRLRHVMEGIARPRAMLRYILAYAISIGPSSIVSFGLKRKQ